MDLVEATASRALRAARACRAACHAVPDEQHWLACLYQFQKGGQIRLIRLSSIPLGTYQEYNITMTLKLTDELRSALAQEPGQPLEVEDPVTHDRYVLVHMEVFELAAGHGL